MITKKDLKLQYHRDTGHCVLSEEVVFCNECGSEIEKKIQLNEYSKWVEEQYLKLLNN